MIFVLVSLLALVHAQQVLQLNSLSSFSASTSLLALPSSSQLTVSVAICASEASDARFFLSNSSSGSVPGPSGGTNVFEIKLDNGSGQWSGSAPNGGLLSIQDLTQGSFQVSVSNNGTSYQLLDQLPLLGDTTSNQAIIYSHSFLHVPIVQPTYPNYTLPPANISNPDIPSSVPNFTLVLAPTSSQLSALPQTACALLNTSSAGSILRNDPWLKNEDWRSQWLIEGLSSSTNYTAYVIQDSTMVSGPIYLATKSGRSFLRSSSSLFNDFLPSASFQCPLVYSLPYCPSTAYAVPLPPPPSNAFGYNDTTLADNITSPLLQYMTNFTTMLTTFACGRDLYSPLQTCANCQNNYRKWLCSVSFPRCSEAVPSQNSNGAQVPLPALQPQASGSPARNPNFPNATYDYTSLLPCLETCNEVDRACPYFLGIKCPTSKFNAGASYGIGFIDSGKKGEIGNGATGAAQDRWGNVWCNGD